jgi:predicted RNA-binding protein
MCESKVYVVKGDARELVMSEVVRMELVEEGVKVYDILGVEKTIERVRVLYADLLSHEIVLEGT